MNSAKVNGFINQKTAGALYLGTICHREAFEDDPMTRKKGDVSLESMRAGCEMDSLASTGAHVS